jgi:hypothetical protein
MIEIKLKEPPFRPGFDYRGMVTSLTFSTRESLKALINILKEKDEELDKA